MLSLHNMNILLNFFKKHISILDNKLGYITCQHLISLYTRKIKNWLSAISTFLTYIFTVTKITPFKVKNIKLQNDNID